MDRRSCCTLNLVRIHLYRLRLLYKRNGLKSHKITLENGTTMHCWILVDKESLKRKPIPRTVYKNISRSTSNLQQNISRSTSNLQQNISRSTSNLQQSWRQGQRWIEENNRRMPWGRGRGRGRGSAPGHPSMPPNMPPGMAPPGMAPPGMAPPGMAPPGMPPGLPPGAPPGMVPQGMAPGVPPGVPHGMGPQGVPPGMMPPGGPPGVYPPRPPNMHGRERRPPYPGTPMDEGRANSSIPVRERPVLVLLHGFGGNGTMAWEKQVAAFSQEYRLIIPDLLFFGTSTTTSEHRTEIFQADCVVDLLTHLNIEVAHILGLSYGGFVAFWMAYKYPNRFRKVVLVGCGVCMNPSTNDKLLKDCNLTLNDLMLPTTVDGLKLALSLIYEKRPLIPDFVLQQLLDVLFAPQDRPQRVELLKALVIGSESCPPLPVLQQRVLIIWGRCDQIFKLKLGYELQKHLGHSSSVAVIENAGHMPQQEKPKEFNSIVAGFLATDS